MKIIMAFFLGLLNLPGSQASRIDWRDCGDGSRAAGLDCGKLLSEAFVSSEVPQQKVLQRTFVSKREGSLLISKNRSLFIKAINQECSGEKLKECVSEAHKEVDQQIRQKSYEKDFSAIHVANGEWAFKLQATKGKIWHLYHLRQNGNFLIGYRNDLNPAIDRKQWFLFNMDQPAID